MSNHAMKSNSQVHGETFFSGVSAVLRSPRWRRRVAWAVAAWLLLWALAYAAVPWILKSQLEKIGSEKLGRQLTVGAVDFKPWSLELTIHDLVIAKARPTGFSGAAGSQTAASGSASLPVQPPSSQTSSLLKIKRLYV